MAETVRKFIQDFENRFYDILEAAGTKEGEPVCTKHFLIWKAKKKYSDWDLHCRLKPNALTVDNLETINSFVRAFKGITNVGALISFSSKYSGLPHHIDNLTWLQFMAFMPEEKSAPFIDIHVEGLNKKVLKAAFSGKSDEELMKWMMLTSWRKFKNGWEEDARGILKGYVLRSFPQVPPSDIETEPEKFFKSQFRGGAYKEIAGFLNS